MVKARWGLTAGEVQECYFQLTLLSTETFTNFVLQEEDEHQHLGISEGETFRHFLNFTPDSMRAWLE